MKFILGLQETDLSKRQALEELVREFKPDYFFLLNENDTFTEPLKDTVILIKGSTSRYLLRIANQLSGQALFEWEVLSETGAPVACSNGLEVNVDGPLRATRPRAMIFVCAGVEPEKSASRPVSDWLRQQWRSGRTVGGLCTGAYALAKAGILEGRSFTLHWENLPPFVETFGHLRPLEQLYCIDSIFIHRQDRNGITGHFYDISGHWNFANY